MPGRSQCCGARGRSLDLDMTPSKSWKAHAGGSCRYSPHAPKQQVQVDEAHPGSIPVESSAAGCKRLLQESPKKTNCQIRSRCLLQFVHRGVGAASPFGGEPRREIKVFLHATLSDCLRPQGVCGVELCRRARRLALQTLKLKSTEFLNAASACDDAPVRPARRDAHLQGNVTKT